MGALFPLLVIAIGTMLWAPGVYAIVFGKWDQPRPMGLFLIFLLLQLPLLFWFFKKLSDYFRERESSWHPALSTLVYALCVLTTIAPFYIFPLLGYRFGK